MNFVKTFVEDMKYYDPLNKELDEIKKINLKGKTLVDIGAGSGRLSIPLSKSTKRIFAIEMNKQLAKYIANKNIKNIEIINQKAEFYLKNKKFDILILAWPTFEFKWINLIRNSMHKDSHFIFTTCKSDSEYESIIDKLEISDKKSYAKNINNKEKFINMLPKKFKLVKKKLIKTSVEFLNKETAFRIIKNSLVFWFKISFNKEKDEKLKKLIEKNRNGNKIIFKEEVWFYLLTK